MSLMAGTAPQATHLIKPLVALLAIINPLGILPIFLALTEGFTPAQRKRTITTCAFSSFMVIAVSALLGTQVLQFFSISLASFQVGAGLLLLITGIGMLNAAPTAFRSTPEEMDEAEASSRSIAVVPLTVPLLTGPATISTMIIYADKNRHWPYLLVLVGYGVIAALVIAGTFRAAESIAGVVGKTGINIMTRLMGLLIAALSVELMSEGLLRLFPGLGR